MTILSDIEKVTDESFLFVLFDTLFLISPGLLIIYYFHRDLFLNLDSIKLVLLSIATTLPFLCWNIILIFQLLYRGKLIDANEKKSFFFMVSVALIGTNTFVYMMLFVSYTLGTSFKSSLIFVVVIEVLLTILTVLVNRRMKNIIKKSNEQPIDYVPIFPR